jgi:DNA-binding MarR family transcriptional regulator
MTKKGEPFIKLPYAVYDSPAFATLKPIDIAVLLLPIHKHNGHNNGGIGLGLREIASGCHRSFSTASRALDRLQKADLAAPPKSRSI